MGRGTGQRRPTASRGDCCLGGKCAPVCCQPLSIACLGACVPAQPFLRLFPGAPTEAFLLPHIASQGCQGPVPVGRRTHLCRPLPQPCPVQPTQAGLHSLTSCTAARVRSRVGMDARCAGSDKRERLKKGTRKDLRKEVLLGGPRVREGLPGWTWGYASSEQAGTDTVAERQRPGGDSAWLDHDGREEEWTPEPKRPCWRPSLEKWLV